MYQDLCHDRYNEVKQRGKFKIVDEKWQVCQDFGFHKWPGRRLNEDDEHFTSSFPREITIIDEQGQPQVLSMLSEIDYSFAVGNLTQAEWEDKKDRSPFKFSKPLVLVAVVCGVLVLGIYLLIG